MEPYPLLLTEDFTTAHVAYTVSAIIAVISILLLPCGTSPTLLHDKMNKNNTVFESMNALFMVS